MVIQRNRPRSSQPYGLLACESRLNKTYLVGLSALSIHFGDIPRVAEPGSSFNCRGPHGVMFESVIFKIPRYSLPLYKMSSRFGFHLPFANYQISFHFLLVF